MSQGQPHRQPWAQGPRHVHVNSEMTRYKYIIIEHGISTQIHVIFLKVSMRKRSKPMGKLVKIDTGMDMKTYCPYYDEVKRASNSKINRVILLELKFRSIVEETKRYSSQE